MSNKIIKGALVGVVGVSTATTGYYTMVKPNLQILQRQLLQVHQQVQKIKVQVQAHKQIQIRKIVLAMDNIKMEHIQVL